MKERAGFLTTVIKFEACSGPSSPLPAIRGVCRGYQSLWISQR